MCMIDCNLQSPAGMAENQCHPEGFQAYSFKHTDLQIVCLCKPSPQHFIVLFIQQTIAVLGRF